MRAGGAAGLLLVLGMLAPGAQAADQPLRIYPLGDSITYGTSSLAPVPGGYRDPLHALLGTLGIAHTFVGSQTGNPTASLASAGQSAHEGHPRYRIDQVTRGLTGTSGGGSDAGGSWLLGRGSRPAIDPDVVLVLVGANDILTGYDPGTRYPTGSGAVDFTYAPQRAVFIDHLAARLRTLVETLHQHRPHARLVVGTLLPIGERFCDAITPDYAPRVQELVRELGAEDRPVVLADTFSAFADTARGGCKIRPGMLSDPVHPTELGYRVLAHVFGLALAAP